MSVVINTPFNDLYLSAMLPETVSFTVQDENASAVVKVEASPVDVNSPFYNLNGQRVKNPRKGIFIQNGRKVVIK